MSIWIWVVVLAVFFLIVLPEVLLAGVIYTVLLVRTSKKKWGRDVKLPENDEEYCGMYYEGLDWGELYSGYKREVEVQSGKYHRIY